MNLLSHAARVLAVVLMLLASAPLFAGEAVQEQPTQAVLTPSVEYLEGDVFVDGVAAEFGMPLAQGARVTVGDDSMAEIAFGPNIMRIYEGTSIVIDIGDVTSRVNLESGAMAAVFDKLERIGNDGNFQVNTPTAVGGVRGTVFYVRVESPDSTFVCVCNGSVALQSSVGTDEQTITASHHSGLRFLRTGDGSISTEIPEMAYHTDDEMESLAAKINSQIDWTTAK